MVAAIGVHGMDQDVDVRAIASASQLACDVVVAQAFSQRQGLIEIDSRTTHGAGLRNRRRNRGTFPRKKPGSQYAIHHFLEGLPRFLDSLVQQHRYIVIQRESGAHPPTIAF